ncbi:ABC transporter permease [Methylocaldum szegediense]|uniref:Lipoprotein-releasing system permease protein n=1 Tax=Methylocaldum szegediense TaxID=73780 RepID=A0ABN8XAH7_9GAMM|nr:FtsX-like permease family protein [Methylocaldum szegediense]CAI8936824.1 lipoprotein-releasing system permease protein [Methylocaldum szegediense]
MFLIKVAWRNILRHKRRSLFALLTILSGVTGIVLFGGFVEANYVGLRESVIRSQYGHLQIHRAGYEANHRQDPDRYRMPPEQAEQVKALLESNPHVQMTSRRLEFTALLGNEKNSQAAIVRGVDPETETLINSALTIIDGTDLDEEEPEGVLLGEGLAQALNAKVGDQLSLLASTVNGVMNAVDVKVQGIFQSFAKEYDDAAMMMTLPHAQQLLNTQSVDTVVALLDETMALDEVVADVAARSQAQDLGIEWVEWHKLATFYQKVVDLYDGFFLFINLVIYVVVVFGVANTMIVTVMERTAEIGTLRAMGTHRGGIVRQFLIEGLMLGVLGAVLGVLVGIALTYSLNALEIMMPPPPGSSKGYPLRIAYVPEIWAGSVGAVALIALFATLVPAMQAARKSIVDALRYV